MVFKSPFRNLPFQKKGYLALGSGFLLHFILGTFYMWGSISTYITSYLKHDGQDFTKEDVGAVFPFTLLAINIGTPLGPYFATKFGFRIYLLVCSVTLGIVVIISSFLLKNFYIFVLLYGFTFGLLTGLMYMVPFNTGYLYFPQKKGLVSGVITGGFGFGATVFIWVMFALINPNNEKASVAIGNSKYFSIEVCDRLPNAIRILGIIQIIGASIAAFLHERPNQEECQQQDKHIYELTHPQHQSGEHSPPPGSVGINIIGSHHVDTYHQEDQHSQDHHDHPGISDDHHHDEHPINQDTHKFDHPQSETTHSNKILKPTSSSGGMGELPKILIKKNEQQYYEFNSIKEGLSTPFIYISIILTLLYAAYGAMTVSNYKLYGEHLGYQDSFLSAAGTAGSVFNGISRLFWGSLMEKLKIKQIIFANLTLQIIISITYQYVSSISALFIIYVILGYFVYGGWYSVMPTLITRIYGKKIGTNIFGVTFIGFSLASFTQFFLVKIVQEAIGWGSMFFVFTGIQVFALILTCIVRFEAVPPSIKKANKQSK